VPWRATCPRTVAREVAKRAVEEGRSLETGVRRFVARYVDDRAILPAE
jgi:hypothetical protein